jgi:hypothetical protein
LVAMETNRPPLQIGFFRMTLRYLHGLLAHPPDSILRRALRDSIRGGPSTWAGLVAQWASSVGAPIDAQLLAQAAAIPPRPRQQPPRTGSPAPALGDTVTVVTPQEGYEKALQRWAASFDALRGVRAGNAYARREAARLRFVLSLPDRAPSTRPLRTWNRRLPLFYRQFPTFGQRSIVARTRLALPVRGLSVWSPPDYFDDGSDGPYGHRALWRFPLGGDGREHDPDPARQRECVCGCQPQTLAHAYACPRFRVAVAASATPCHLDFTVPWADQLVASPPPSWPVFVHAVSRI